jgi:predicted MFS family arabinose efflux permease
LLGQWGWRGAYFGLAALTLCAVPIIAFLLRRTSDVTEPVAREWNWPLFADRRFVLLAVIFLLCSTGVFGSIVHFVPMLTDRGIAPAKAAAVAGLLGFAVIVGRLITGYLLDRIEANVLAAVIFTISAAGLLMLASGHSELILPGTLALGFTIGAEFDLAGYMIGKRFPVAQFGTLFGGVYAAVSIGGGVGPILAGLMFDAYGSYLAWFAVAASSLVLSSLLCLLNRSPAFRDRAAAITAQAL